MPRSYVKISDTVVFGIPRSASSSHTVSHWSVMIVACPCQHSQVFCLLQAFHTWTTFNRFSTMFEAFVQYFHLSFLIVSSHCIKWKPTWIIWIVSMEECSNLTQNLMQIICIYMLSHFECNGHTVHMLTHQHLRPPLTSTVKSSLFMHVHSSPLSLHWCHANHSPYINNSWTFSGQIS